MTFFLCVFKSLLQRLSCSKHRLLVIGKRYPLTFIFFCMLVQSIAMYNKKGATARGHGTLSDILSLPYR